MKNIFTMGRVILWHSGVVILGMFFWWWRIEIAQARDADRFSDMRYIAAGMAELYGKTHSYEDAAQGCSKVGDLVSQCSLKSYLDKIDTITDPGSGQYLVTKVPDDAGYEMSFTLERGYGEYKAGKHTLTQDGIQ